MRKHSKRYSRAAEKIDRARSYDPKEALTLIKSLPAAKFDETVDVVVKLGIDPKKTDQLVRGAVSLPKGLGKSVRVVVFAEGDKARGAGIGRGRGRQRGPRQAHRGRLARLRRRHRQSGHDEARRQAG